MSTESSAEQVKVEVAYARPEQQLLLEVTVAAGSTLEEAVRASGVLDRFPEIDLGKNQVGVFGKLTPLGARLKAGDRVEVYRPLLADPKEVRKLRAAQGKRMKRGGGPLEEAG